MKHIAAFIAAHSGVGATALHTNDLRSRSSSLIKVSHRELLSSAVSSAQCDLLPTVQRCIVQSCKHDVRSPAPTLRRVSARLFSGLDPDVRVTGVLITVRSDDTCPPRCKKKKNQGRPWSQSDADAAEPVWVGRASGLMGH